MVTNTDKINTTPDTSEYAEKQKAKERAKGEVINLKMPSHAVEVSLRTEWMSSGQPALGKNKEAGRAVYRLLSDADKRILVNIIREELRDKYFPDGSKVDFDRLARNAEVPRDDVTGMFAKLLDVCALYYSTGAKGYRVHEYIAELMGLETDATLRKW